MATLEAIKIQPEAIAHALSDNSLTVPVNQRSYAWEEKHVTELFQDLANAIATREGEYFLGSIVVSKTDGRPEVVDGQQRLATTTILLAAIRDHFYSTKDLKRAEYIEQKYLMSRDLRTEEILPRLRLNAIDHDYFMKRVLTRPDETDRQAKAIKDSHSRIDQAAKLAEKHVQEIVQPYAAQDRVNRLLDWVEYLEKQARVIWVTVPDHANAFVIFETLNDRGLVLSISDLLKNYLFGRSDDRIAETQQRWFSMIGALESVSGEEIVVTYIRHLWSSMYGPTRGRDLFTSIKDNVKSKQAAIDLATELAQSANIYAALLNPDHELWNAYGTSARRHVATLLLLRMEQLRPLMLAAVKLLPPEEVKRCLRLLVFWSVRFLVVGGLGGGTMERHYAFRGQEIRAGKVKNASDLVAPMVEVVPGDAQFEAAFGTARVSQSYLARYYLRALELEARGTAEPELVPNTDEEVVNLEHVLPQSPSAAWGYIDPDAASANYRRIGNLVLMKAGENAAAGNDGFEVKKAYYNASSFVLTSEVGKCLEWGPAQIEERQRKLAKIAVKTWPLKT